MSIGQALNTSLSGLRATQAGLSLVASNVANAQTPGYTRKGLDIVSSVAGENGNGVRVAAVKRELDLYLQRQFRVESSGGAYADLRANFYQRLQQIYGQPGSESTLETAFNTFSSAVQSLVTSPDSMATRSVVISSAQVLAQSLNGMTTDIQALRADAEGGLSDAVATANNAMKKIAEINVQLSASNANNASDASLLDQRDFYVDQLSELMDVRVIAGNQNQISVFTNSGIQLVDSNASVLAFNPQGTVSAATLWDDDASKSNLGSLLLVSATGSSIDLIANKSIRSGKIAAYLEMRDHVLVEAQNQLDSMASVMAQALSDDTIDGDPVTSGAQSGFEVDTADWLDGNRLNLTYLDRQTNSERRVTIVRVDDPDALPLGDAATADPNDQVIGVDFSGGLSSVVSQLNAKFGGLLQFSNPGTTLRVLDDGALDVTDVEAFSLTQTANSLTTGRPAIGLFTDGATPYTGAITAIAAQGRGLAGRITVNRALLGDPSKIVIYGSGVANGDPARPNLIYDRLVNASFAFSPETGLGIANSPFTGNLPSFLRQVLSMQGEAGASATSLSQGQAIVVNALKERVSDASGVNVDQEMAHLITLQTAYGANARVMAVARDMLETLLKV